MARRLSFPVARKFTPCDFRIRFVEAGLFLSRQLDDGTGAGGLVQQQARDGILRIGRQGADGFDGVVEQAGRGEMICV